MVKTFIVSSCVNCNICIRVLNSTSSTILPQKCNISGYEAHPAFCLIRVFPRDMCLCQVTWTPDTDRGRVRGLQQAANEKLSLEEIRQRGITSLTLHYSKASHRDIQ